MSTTISYEILTLRLGKWEVEGVSTEKEQAKEQALETLGSGHYEAVKVIGERLNNETGESTSFTVLSREDQRKAGGTPPSTKERRKPVERRKTSERRKRPDRRKKAKKSSLVDFPVKVGLTFWAIIASAAFMICQLLN